MASGPYTHDPDFGPYPVSVPRVRFDAIGAAWRLFWAQGGAWLLTGLLVWASNWAVYGVLQAVFKTPPLRGDGPWFTLPTSGGYVHGVLLSVLDAYFFGGMIRMACRQIRGATIHPTEVFRVEDVLPQLALGAAIAAVAGLFAASFCFIPALILGGVWMFMIPLIVDGRFTAAQAIGRSWQVLKGQWFQATLFHLVISIIGGLGLCCGTVGIIVTEPLYCLAMAVLYRDFFLGKFADVYTKPQPYDDFA